jgi:acyl-coenzyme A synthetase/AMP-(fatty) acid ligase/3-hydroxymyristoyl/3-hydroxydecanoyl-(acyl carrier protein) dehydratase
LVVYTSGSSGAPVAIIKRLAQLFDEVRSLSQGFDARVGDARICTTVSHQHIYGLLFAVLWPLACGRPFAAQRLAFAEDIAAEVAKGGACVLIASPAHLKRLPDQLPWAAVRDNLRAVFSSGGPLPDEALPPCLSLLGHAPIEVYGSSETGGVAWRQRQPDGALAWQALPNVDLKVQDEALHICSPHADAVGWQAMSDRVRAVDGGFELLGRSDRIVKIEEKRVSLNAVEQALMGSGLLAEVRVLVQADRRTQLIVAGVPSESGWSLLDREGKQVLNARLRAALEMVVEPSALPRRWRYVSSLPVNPQGKTTEAALLALFDPRRPQTRVLTRSACAVSLQVEIAAQSPYFDGHFHEAPVLPGVAQLDWVVRFGREFFDLPPRFLRMEGVKFQQVIKPGPPIEMALSFDADRGRLSFALKSETGSHASGRIVFGSAE